MIKYIGSLLAVLLLLSQPAYAQGQEEKPANDYSVAEKAQMVGKDFDLNSLVPLIFTRDEFVLLQEALKSFTTRPPTSGDLRQADEFDPEAELPDPGIRELSLSGIVYRGSNDWTVWLNNQRVTPDAIPEEVLDIKVSKKYISLKWYDAYTNRIFPIRLRPHERFNLDTLIYLPG